MRTELTLLHILALAVVQGISEFLPISSSGHLAILSDLAGWEDQGLSMDVMVHVGSFFAVVVYFWKDIVQLFLGGLELLRLNLTDRARLSLYIILATIPAVIFGLYLKKSGFMDSLRTDTVFKFKLVGWGALFFGTLLYLSDRYGHKLKVMEEMKFAPAFMIGLAQAIAIIPGTSRSGITMTAARFLGFKRPEAARFSFLLGVPAIAGAGLLTILEFHEAGQAISTSAYLAAAMTFITSILAIAFLMALIKRMGFLPFVLYRYALGIFLLFLAYNPGYIPGVA